MSRFQSRRFIDRKIKHDETNALRGVGIGAEGESSGGAVGGSEGESTRGAVGGSEGESTGGAVGGSEGESSGGAVGGSEGESSGRAVGGSEGESTCDGLQEENLGGRNGEEIKEEIGDEGNKSGFIDIRGYDEGIIGKFGKVKEGSGEGRKEGKGSDKVGKQSGSEVKLDGWENSSGEHKMNCCQSQIPEDVELVNSMKSGGLPSTDSVSISTCIPSTRPSTVFAVPPSFAHIHRRPLEVEVEVTRVSDSVVVDDAAADGMCSIGRRLNENCFVSVKSSTPYPELYKFVIFSRVN